MSESSGRKLRIGLLVDRLEQPAWVAQMLDLVARSDYAEICLVVRNDAPFPAKDSRLRRLWRKRANLMFRVFEKLEKAYLNLEHDAFVPTDVNTLLNQKVVEHVTPRQTKFSDYIEPPDLAKLRSYDIDVFIRLGFRILRGEILNVARYGVWSFHHGDNLVNRGSPPGVWEVLENAPLTGSILQILGEDLDNGEVLTRSWSATDGTWPKRNRNKLYWRSLAMLPRQLQALHRDGEKRFFDRVAEENKSPLFYSRRLYVEPNNIEFIRGLLAVGGRYAYRKVAELIWREQWGLRFYLGEDFPAAIWKFKVITPPKNCFWADPFVIHRDDKYYVYFENLPYATNKGHLSMLTVDKNGDWSEPIKILDKPFHLSYPFLFEWEGEIYMMPEMSANKRIDVYRCARFPDQWEFHVTLMSNVHAVDATLFENEGKWWMFVCLREYPGAVSGEDLFLFCADTPLSTAWKAHPMNPVVTDVRRARPAGNLIRRGGAIYRPSQDGAKRYGGAININRVVKLNEYEYIEEPVSRIEPKWQNNLLGTHTLNRAESFTIIDAEIRRLRWF